MSQSYPVELKNPKACNPTATWLCCTETEKGLNKMIKVFITQKRPRVDFANILCEAFTCADPKSAKNLSVFFALLGSAHEKTLSKMLVKSTPN